MFQARTSREAESPPLVDRLRTAVLKPIEPGSYSDESDEEIPSVDELTDAVRYADDKERLVGLIGAPLAATIGLLVMTAMIDDDPAALLKNGQVNKLHIGLSLYYDLTAVVLGLAVLMLVMALLRKRLLLGITMALYGLAIFNLHFWGFGVPFIFAAAWLLVRAYRLQRDLRAATDAEERELSSSRRPSRPPPSGRYTAATARRR